MKFTKIATTLSLAAITGLMGCAAAENAAGTATCSNATRGASSGVQIGSSGSADIPVYIADSSITGTVGYQNEPLVSVTICTPGHTSSSQCQTIGNILLDTGSYGLRIFSSAIASNVQLQQQSITITGGGSSTTADLAQCATFGSGADWGPIMAADLILGSSNATAVPIQVINYNYNTMPSTCLQLQPDTDPCSAGFNGIMGVGPFAVDCGADCAPGSNGIPDLYYGCNSYGCGNEFNSVPITVAISAQVTNPVSAFGLNGISLTLPSVSLSTGASQVQGTMVLGIPTGTVQAAQPPFSTFQVYDAYSAHEILDLTSLFNTQSSTSYYGDGDPTQSGATNSFIDSGSNGIYVPQITGLVNCGDGSGFYCPTTPQTLAATISSYSSTSGQLGSPSSGEFNFYMYDADTLFNSGNSAFSSLGGNGGTGLLDWGLPFFFGKTIYVGLENKHATYSGVGLVTGPNWAF